LKPLILENNRRLFDSSVIFQPDNAKVKGVKSLFCLRNLLRDQIQKVRYGWYFFTGKTGFYEKNEKKSKKVNFFQNFSIFLLTLLKKSS